MTTFSLNLALWGTVIGMVSAVLGAIGAGVGVYIALRLEVAQIRAEVERVGLLFEHRVGLLEKDIRAIGGWVRENTGT